MTTTNKLTQVIGQGQSDGRTRLSLAVPQPTAKVDIDTWYENCDSEQEAAQYLLNELASDSECFASRYEVEQAHRLLGVQA